MVVGIPGTENIKQNKETGEFILYANIRGDYYEIAKHNNLLKMIRKRNKILDDGGYEKYLLDKHRLRIHNKYYHKHHNKFVISKFINGKLKVFGTVDSEETAKRIVYILFYNNWDVDSLPLKFQEELKPRSPKNYCLDKGMYCVYKQIDGVRKTFGYYETEDEAKEVVEELKLVNWDVNRLPYLIKRDILDYWNNKEQIGHKYYHFDKKSNVWIISKSINGKTKYICRCSNEDNAKTLVESLKKVDWDINSLSEDDKRLIIKKSDVDTKYYTYDKYSDKWFIQKCINGKQISYGRYATEEEAADMVELLKKAEWDIKQLPEEYQEKFKDNYKHYYKTRNGGYKITKYINGKEHWFGSYKTEKEAQERVEELKKNNWDNMVKI